jgi:hypothetical protein
MKFLKQISFLVGNATLKSLNIKKEFVEKIVDGGVTL